MPAPMPAPGPSAAEFNQEIVIGECGSLTMAYVAAFFARSCTHRPAIISGAIVAGTLSGGTLLWLVTRIYHRRRDRRWSARSLAHDISYFTPAALAFGFGVYDPVLYFTAHALLVHGRALAGTVIAAQLLAFSLFLACMNAYRWVLLKTGRRRL